MLSVYLYTINAPAATLRVVQAAQKRRHLALQVDPTRRRQRQAPPYTQSQLIADEIDLVGPPSRVGEWVTRSAGCRLRWCGSRGVVQTDSSGLSPLMLFAMWHFFALKMFPPHWWLSN